MEGASERPRGARRRAVYTFLGIATFVLVVFLVRLVVDLSHDVAHLTDVLATRDDLENLVSTLIPSDRVETTLESSCADCHTTEKFREAHGLEGDIPDLVERMRQFGRGSISPDEVPRVEAALSYLKCAHCHSLERIKELAIMSPEERWQVILTMMKEPGSEITQEDARRIRDFYGSFWGWHGP